MNDKTFNILLVDDDEDDYIIIRDTLDSIRGSVYLLDWAPGYEDAWERIRENHYDACLMDYRLGRLDGISLMEEFLCAGFQAPIIILTGFGDYDIDLQAMKKGAFDYLEKNTLSPKQLERTIRYSVEKWLLLSELKKSQNKIRMLSSQVIDLQEQERKRIARELHDGIGADLTAIKYALEMKLREMKNNLKEQGCMTLEQIIGMVRDTMLETRRLSHNLRPAILDDFGLVHAIQSLIKDFEAIYKDTLLEPDIRVLDQDVPEELKIIIYRIFQESLNNVFKHSGADSVRIFLGRTTDGLEISVTDNGSGFSPEKRGVEKNRKQGMGLEGMKERVELCGGQFECLSEKGRGSIIRAVWPVVGEDEEIIINA